MEGAESLFSSDWVVLSQIAGPRLPMSSAVGVARQLRRALQSVADEPIVTCLSGHESSGAMTSAMHLAIQPLPFVGHPLADGHLQALALVWPKGLPQADKAACLLALSRLQHPKGMDGRALVVLDLGDTGRLVFEVVLQPHAWAQRWSAPSLRWTTALPIALDRNPGHLYDSNPTRREKARGEARAAIVRALSHIGLEALTELTLHVHARIEGAAPANAFPRFPSQVERPQRVLTHATLMFEKPVLGPLILGAGRFHGLGFCLPLANP